MPKFKKERFHFKNDAGAELDLNVDINISADGVFYANLPDHLAVAFDFSANTKAVGKFKLSAKTYDELRNKIDAGIRRAMTPEVEEYPVIRYNIESHVTFAIGENGEIFPNSGFPGASWPDREVSERFGHHYAQNPSRGGYTLKIAARAEMKKITRYGDKSQVAYSNYYKGGSHLAHDNPANLLNSWVSMTLGDSPKEIPYSDKAALFFHNLLLGMAKLNQQIQSATFEQDRLLAFIENQSCVPMLSASTNV
jgi:hypothetical protein